MGMTIEKIKQELMKILAFTVRENQYDAVKHALIIINKYQKIEEIVKVWEDDDITYEGHYGEDYMQKIREVMEDGTD